MHQTASDMHRSPRSAPLENAPREPAPLASTATFGAPIIVHFPTISRDRESIRRFTGAAASTHIGATTAPPTTLGLPTYDGVNDVLEVADAEQAGPRIHVPAQPSNEPTSTASLPRPQRIPSPMERRLLTTDLSESLLGVREGAASWRPVIVLAIVLSAAAGLTFWIAFGGANVNPTLPTDSIGWPAEPSEVVSIPNRGAGDIIAPVGAASNCEELNQLHVADGQTPFCDANAPYAIGPQRTQSQTGRETGSKYPNTNFPSEWRIERVATAVGPDGAPRATVRSSDPVVSFGGSIETPNLRAQHDNNESSLH